MWEYCTRVAVRKESYMDVEGGWSERTNNVCAGE